ncbi:glycine cleavage system protein T [Candidatus Pseudothioglobus singularis]|nr:glycine cleavage system protein T [Candidatus Pseudothioglobus singularis]
MKKEFSFGTQVRKSPYFDATVRWGAKGFSVYNHMYIPRDFGDPVQNFWNLVNDAILCDVAVERQVEITGPNAAQFVQLLTPRNLSECAVGQCKYVLITDENGGVLNDPVLLRLAENHFWLSLADSDILMWAKGVAVNSGLDVNLGEPDVSPLQLQGPRSGDIAKAIFGERIDSLKYYWLEEFELNGIPLIISRTGWSSELGYEIYLRDGSRGNELWDHIMEVGKPMGLVPGHTSTIRRIEGGMLSYQADMNYTVNPFELGLGRLVDLEMNADFIGKKALKKIKSDGIKRSQVGIEISCTPLKHPNTSYWPIMVGSEEVGYITSAVYSPRLDKNIALAMMDVNHSAIDTAAETTTPEGNFPIKVVQKPFYDPKKKITSGS